MLYIGLLVVTCYFTIDVKSRLQSHQAKDTQKAWYFNLFILPVIKSLVLYLFHFVLQSKLFFHGYDIVLAALINLTT